jgi:hypothetical protein
MNFYFNINLCFIYFTNIEKIIDNSDTIFYMMKIIRYTLLMRFEF